jgi:hypothetical protein
MIYADSRYASGFAYRTYDARRDANLITVRRSFPRETSSFFYVTWREGDRMESIAYEVLGSSSLWWRIMDYNPEILDAINIPVGSLIRVPYDD